MEPLETSIHPIVAVDPLHIIPISPPAPLAKSLSSDLSGTPDPIGLTEIPPGYFPEDEIIVFQVLGLEELDPTPISLPMPISMPAPQDLGS